MKNLKLYLSYLILATAPFVTCILGMAEQNYRNAINETMRGEGTDAAIEETMHIYGFDVDAINPKEPTVTEKLKAIF
jgi:hypothetical protein